MTHSGRSSKNETIAAAAALTVTRPLNNLAPRCENSAAGRAFSQGRTVSRAAAASVWLPRPVDVIGMYLGNVSRDHRLRLEIKTFFGQTKNESVEKTLFPRPYRPIGNIRNTIFNCLKEKKM